MSEWKIVKSVRKKARNGPASNAKTSINAAGPQAAASDSQPKYGAGANKQHGTDHNAAKLDRENDVLKHQKIPLEVGKLIMKGRQSKGLSQKDLAMKICEKQQIVTDYESGRGIPNNLILGKIERVIGIKLRGKDRGQPLAPPTKN